MENQMARSAQVEKCFMDRRTTILVLASLLCIVALPCAAVKNETIRIKVLDSDTRSISTGDNGVPKNCDAVNYDAYCHSSKTAEVINTLLVQQGDDPPYRVSCAIETKWSRCVPLLKGYSFDARREKNGITIYYLDDNGKMRKQLYTYLTQDKAQAKAQADMQDKKSGPENASAPNASPEPAPKPLQTAPAVGSVGKPEEVKCSFTSTPTGAEISLDGQYLGSTPSVVNVRAGTHEVVVSMPGFAQWKRELTVAAGSELTVNAVLEKAP